MSLRQLAHAAHEAHAVVMERHREEQRQKTYYQECSSLTAALFTFAPKEVRVRGETLFFLDDPVSFRWSGPEGLTLHAVIDGLHFALVESGPWSDRPRRLCWLPHPDGAHPVAVSSLADLGRSLASIPYTPEAND